MNILFLLDGTRKKNVSRTSRMTQCPELLAFFSLFFLSFFLSLFFVFLFFVFFFCLEDATWWFVIAKFNDAPGECIQEGGGLLLQLFFFCLFYIHRINFQDIEKGGREREDEGAKG